MRLTLNKSLLHLKANWHCYNYKKKTKTTTTKKQTKRRTLCSCLDKIQSIIRKTETFPQQILVVICVHTVYVLVCVLMFTRSSPILRSRMAKCVFVRLPSLFKAALINILQWMKMTMYNVKWVICDDKH